MTKKITGFVLAFVCGIGVLAQAGQDEAKVRRRIVGTWKLVFEENTLKDGSKTHEYGPNGKGYLMYTADGHMCAVEMDPDRPKWADPANPTQQEKAKAFDGSYGYCGPYEIDAKHNQLIHLPLVSTGPGYVGTRQLRPFQLEGDRLILTGGAVEQRFKQRSGTPFGIAAGTESRIQPG